MGAELLGFEDIDRTMVAEAGGKGAGLGELSRIAGIRVPPGFVVTTAGAASDAAIRARLEPGARYAVRSSATAEDLPTASFAGQQDSFLNVPADAVPDAVRRCRASLHTDRAIAYRRQQGLAEAAVRMAVVVQRMVDARAAGVMFTADPVSGHRRVTVIEAVAGLGEALVAGQVDPDRYRVRDGRVAGTGVLSQAQVLELERLGRMIEAHVGAPQDVEWCLDDAGFAIVQARPITTLFPIPHAGPGPRVYVSVGHQQMMTDAFRPLGLSLWQVLAARPMYAAGGRPFVDLTPDLTTEPTRTRVLAMFGQADPLLHDALSTVLARGFLPEPEPAPAPAPAAPPGPPPAAPAADEDLPALVTELIATSEAKLAALAEEIAAQSGTALLDFIRAQVHGMKGGVSDPRTFAMIMAGLDATTWLNRHLRDWLGEPNAAAALSLSAPNNVTSEMGLALLDVADTLRGDEAAIAALQAAPDEGFLAALPAPARSAFTGFLDRYGQRTVGEIDLTRPRWRERPTTLVPLVLANLAAFAPGEAARRFAQGQELAAAKQQELLARLRDLPDGDAKAAETAAKIKQLRAVAGYREYPKYAIVSRFWLYKQALQAEAARLGLAWDDLTYLTFDELYGAFEAGRVDAGLVAARRAEHAHHARLTPPRVITSEGEGLEGALDRGDAPAGALVGIPVSAGVAEGRARVLQALGDAELAPGDILVTRFTDPSWTPAFVAIGGLVTEVGGLMTHGAVVAREYGLPAVVGVARATTLIRDGQRIRLHGAAGYVELLS